MIQLCRFKQINTFVIGNRQVLRDLTRFLPGKNIGGVSKSMLTLNEAIIDVKEG